MVAVAHTRTSSLGPSQAPSSHHAPHLLRVLTHHISLFLSPTPALLLHAPTLVH